MLFCSKLGLKVNRLKIDTCPLCGGKQLEHAITCTDNYASGEKFEVMRCTHCGFLFTQEAPVEAEIGRYYETPDYISHSDTNKGLMNRVYHQVRKYMLSRKAKLIKRTSGLSKGSLLDIGTGTGYFSNAMKERGWRVRAIEKNAKARAFAKEHFELEVDAEDALAGYADHSFDAITLWHVMEHLEHLNETWERLAALLKDRGVLIVAVPNPSSYDAVKYKEWWAGIMKALGEKTTKTIGNFWKYLVLSCTRILLPLSLVVGFILIIQGTPMGFDGKMEITTLEGNTQSISQGPAAAIVPIKQLGTNGGGYYGVNSSHPLENPTYLSNMIECCSILIIPMAMVFAFGFYVNRKRLGCSIYGVMLVAFLIGVCINVSQEMGGNPRIDAMGIAQDDGAMEGKEVRLGAGATGLWSVVTTVTSNGSVNGMHDSTMPLSGMIEMLNMQINTWFGGVGVGWMNYFTFIIIAVFISGLMVGRTPEFMCHKVEAKEMKIASIVALLHPFVILVGTALAAYLYVHAPAFVESEGGWLNNPGFHGLGEMLYEFTSCAANNGSGFEGLGDNTWFWNVSCGIVLILSRFIPIIGQVAIAGLLAQKKYIPESAGTLKTDTVTFGVMTFAVIFIVAALSFFPAQALSTIAEHFSL